MTNIDTYTRYPSGKLEINGSYDFGIFKDNNTAARTDCKKNGNTSFSRTLFVLLAILSVIFLVGLILARNRIDTDGYHHQSSELRYRRLLLTPSSQNIPKDELSSADNTVPIEEDIVANNTEEAAKSLPLTGVARRPNSRFIEQRDDRRTRPMESMMSFEKLENFTKSIPVFEINNLAESSAGGRTVLQSVQMPPNLQNNDKKNYKVVVNDTEYKKKRTLLVVTTTSKSVVNNSDDGGLIKNDKFGAFDEVYENNEIEYAQLNAYRSFRKVKSVADIIDYLEKNFDRVLQSPAAADGDEIRPAAADTVETTTTGSVVTASGDGKYDNKNVTTMTPEKHTEGTLSSFGSWNNRPRRKHFNDQQLSRNAKKNFTSFRRSSRAHLVPLEVFSNNNDNNDDDDDHDHDDDYDHDHDHDHDDGNMQSTVDDANEKLRSKAVPFGSAAALRRFSNRMYKKKRRNHPRPTTTQYDLDYFLRPPAPHPVTVESLSFTPSSLSYTETILNDGHSGETIAGTQFQNNFAEPPPYHYHQQQQQQQLYHQRHPAASEPMRPISLMMEIFPMNQPGGVGEPSQQSTADNNGNGWLSKDGVDQSNSIISSGQLPPAPWNGVFPAEDKKMWLRINLYPPQPLPVPRHKTNLRQRKYDNDDNNNNNNNNVKK